MAKDDYFVRLNDPRSARRLVLENTRDVLKVLKGYEDFKKIKDKRESLVNTFKSNMNEIRFLVQELKKTLPKSNIKEIRKPLMPQPISVQKPGKDLMKLEQELADIEDKLSSLS